MPIIPHTTLRMTLRMALRKALDITLPMTLRMALRTALRSVDAIFFKRYLWSRRYLLEMLSIQSKG